MRKFLFLSLVNISSIFTSGQVRREVDSLRQVLKMQREDTLKVKTLHDLGWQYIFNKPDSAYFYGEKGVQLSKKLDFREGLNMSYTVLYASEFVKGNYFKALEFATKKLRMAEETNNPVEIAGSFGFIFNCYRDMGDYRTALQYILWQKRIEDSLGIADYSTYTSLGDIYEKMNQLDSALAYEQKAYQMELEKGGGNYTWIPHILGNIHFKMHHHELALAYYRMSLSRAFKSSNYKDIIDNYNGMAKVFAAMHVTDSLIFYSRQALNYYSIVSYKKGAMEASARLARVYKEKGFNDSTLKYLELSAALKDSLYSQEKTMQVQNLAFHEKERQQELNERKMKDETKRKHNLQYALIGIGVISFLILFFLLSHSVIVKTGLIKFLGVIALLLVFEFINLFIHPYLVHSTNDSPLFMLLVMVCIAALLVPAHHRLEKWITTRLVEKNKKIRLYAAKKTIAELEGNEQT